MARPVNVTDEAIVCALTARPEVTSAEVAEALGIGQSTAAKRLAALESAGSVRRSPGGRLDGRRVADRWAVVASPAVSDTAPPLPPEIGAVVGEPVVGEPEIGESEVGDAAPGGTESAPAADETNGPGAPAAAGDVPAGETEPRLRRGELGSLVRQFLAAHPGESFGPSAVGKVLGRSRGAISNSLATMAAKGEVELVGDKPRRYRIATGS